jgi:hypothetical protein
VGFGVGVDGFGRGGALLVDFLGLVRGHALAPGSYGLAVVRARSVRISGIILAWLGHRSIHGHFFLGCFIDCIMLRVATVQQYGCVNK